MLIDSPRLHARDRSRWAECEREDALHARSAAFVRHVKRATVALLDFLNADEGGYCGVSWGKDSVVVADLVQRCAATLPLVWIRIDPIENPDCESVRDAFLRMWPSARYEEIQIVAPPKPGGVGWNWRGTLERGFAEAVRRYGDRHVSGVRGEESATRKLRMKLHGESTEKTCAPIGWWSGADVFAYLHAHGLPVHPAYAMSQGGVWERERLRVASLGGKRGAGMGRRAWEWHYYREELRALGEEETTR